MSEPVVLVVEDDGDDVFRLRRALARLRASASLRVVGDGEAAVAYLRGHGEYADRARHPLPALVLLDLKLPLLGGHEVLAELRADRVLASLPVVVLTASPDADDRTRVERLGAHLHVKPVAFADLVALVRGLAVHWPFLAGPEPEPLHA
ncbi:MAG: response regulator [Thermoleophilia bacterium]